MSYSRVKGLKEWNFGIFERESEDLNPPLPYGDFFVTYGGEGGLNNCYILKFEFENNQFKLLEIINHEFDETKG